MESATTSQKKVWSLFFDNTEQKIAVFPGTQTSDILTSIRSIYNFPESQELLFLDEDGIPIVLSAAIPTETKLYVQKKQSVTEAVTAQLLQEPKAPEWYWLEPGNSSHKRKNNNLTVYQPVNETQSHCFGSIVLTSGKHYFTLLFEPLMCCVHGGIEDAHQAGKTRFDSAFLNEVNLRGLFEPDRGLGLTSKPAFEIGFLVDMDQKVLTVTNHPEKKIMTKKEFTWTAVSPVVYFKHEVSITITNGSSVVPAWIQ